MIPSVRIKRRSSKSELAKTKKSCENELAKTQRSGKNEFAKTKRSGKNELAKTKQNVRLKKSSRLWRKSIRLI